MSVHYKFKSTLNFDTITFDGLHISVGDLKREIIQQKRLGKVLDFDLQITNAQTKDEYKDDGFLIPKNTTLIISRIPIVHQAKKGWEQPQENPFSSAPQAKQENFNMDLSKMQGSEEDKINAMMMQSTADYDPKTYHRIKGQSQVGEVPATYRCNKCKKGGHWIKNCPFISGKDQFEAKRTTGIPRSFREKNEQSTEQEANQFVMPAEEKQEIPDDLVCGICRDLFVDAVMIPCCGSSFCDDCVRTALLESEESECPDCKEKNCSPGSLIPNRFLRNSVNVFKNETGYKIGTYKATVTQPTASPERTQIEEETPEEQKKEPETTEKPAEEASLSENTETKEETKKETTAAEEEQPAVENSTEPPQKEKDKSDSEYEDNITIKMPLKKAEEPPPNTNDIQKSPPQSHGHSNDHARSSSSRHHHHHHHHQDMYSSEKDLKPPHHSSSSSKMDSSRDNSRDSSRDMPRERAQGDRSLLPTPISVHHNYQNQISEPPMDKPLMNADMGGNHPHRMNPYKPPYIQMPRGPPMHMMGHHIQPFNNGYNNIPHRPPMGLYPYPNQPMHPMRTPYIPPGNVPINSSQPFPSTNLASIYQGVAAKVGTGLIDDPLEAFNRIMKEKEKQKGERRRSPDRHRSRSPERPRHRFKSPLYDRESSAHSKDKGPRSRERDRPRDFSHERRPSRITRRSPRRSVSPGDKRKRPIHRRSPSPKTGYRYGSTASNTKEKASAKPPSSYNSKVDSFEPPPPGFESLPFEGLVDNDMATNHRNSGPSSKDSRPPISAKHIDDETAPRKRPRHASKPREHQDGSEHCYRSLTPPSKVHASTLSKSKGSNDHYKSSPRTPDAKECDLEPRDNRVQHRRPRHNSSSHQRSSPEPIPVRKATPEHSEAVQEHVDKENENKMDSQLKERKKKKKMKSEKKKSKKDKKEKRDKSKKSSSPSERVSKEEQNTPPQENENSKDSPERMASEPPAIPAQNKSNDNNVSGESEPDQRNERNQVAQPNPKSIKKTFENIPLQRFDSVLDIEGYDSDFDESGNTFAKAANKRNDIEALHMSKWELEDTTINPNIGADSSKKMISDDDILMDEQTAITSDVIRKAENAIFAKAINAIRPVEFKVIIDGKSSSSKDASIAYRNEGKDRSVSPKCVVNKSVKDRLGSKVVRDKAHSPDRSQEKRKESGGKYPKEDRHRDRQTPEKYSSSSRKRSHTSKERGSTADRRHDNEKSQQRSRQSNENELEAKSQRDRNRGSSLTNSNRNKSQSTSGNGGRDRGRSGSRSRNSDKSNRHQSPERNSSRRSKSGETRFISSVASRPRPYNPFRKFDDAYVSNTLIPKLEKGSKQDSNSNRRIQSDDSNSESEQEKRRHKDKKTKKHAKYSSTESLRSEKRRDLKSKRKSSKVVKKKKKSKK